MSGRRNWDYVEFADYKSDMEETAAHAAAVISHFRKRAEGAERALAEIVSAAGGSVKVYERDLHDLGRTIVLTTWRNEADMTITFETKTR